METGFVTQSCKFFIVGYKKTETASPSEFQRNVNKGH